MNTQKNYYEAEKAKIKQFKCEAKDVVDELAWKAADEVQERLNAVMPQIREAAENAAAALRAYVESAPIDDDHLKEALYKTFDELADMMEMFLAEEVRRAVMRAFESVRLDIDEKVNMALEGLDLLIA